MQQTDAIDYTPPSTGEREYLDWAMRHHEATRNTAPNGRSRQERNALRYAAVLAYLRRPDANPD